MCQWVAIFSVISVTALCVSSDGRLGPRIPLNDGNFIPVMGFHTGFDDSKPNSARPDNIRDAVMYAINAGYRLIDTAQAYKNEADVGDAVRHSSVPREEIYIVTKLASHKKRDPVGALRESLNKMKLSYVDLYLIHHPVSFQPTEKDFDFIDYVDTWLGLEEAKKLGLAMSIGVSNFNISQIRRLYHYCEIEPSVLQIEVNLNLAQTEFLEYTRSKNLVVMAYNPFGGLYDNESPPPKIYDPLLVQIAKKYDKTTPQVALRYLIQKGVIPMPQSTRQDQIEEYINVFDFKLTPRDMETLGDFNKNFRTVNLLNWINHPYYPFERLLPEVNYRKHYHHQVVDRFA